MATKFNGALVKVMVQSNFNGVSCKNERWFGGLTILSKVEGPCFLCFRATKGVAGKNLRQTEPLRS
jgi:hypothetical protein